jgi:hypothetical protein
MIGYREEEKPTIIQKGNPFRNLAIAMTLCGMTIGDMKSEFNLKQAKTLSKDQFAAKLTSRINSNLQN